MLCSRLNCQNGFHFVLISCKIGTLWVQRSAASLARGASGRSVTTTIEYLSSDSGFCRPRKYVSQAQPHLLPVLPGKPQVVPGTMQATCQLRTGGGGQAEGGDRLDEVHGVLVQEVPLHLLAPPHVRGVGASLGRTLPRGVGEIGRGGAVGLGDTSLLSSRRFRMTSLPRGCPTLSWQRQSK